MTGRFADALAPGERAIEVADATGELTVQSTARLTTSSALEALGRPEDSAAAASEGLQRAEASGNPGLIGAAVITAANNLLNRRAGPDFVRSKEIIDAGSSAFAALGTNELWLCTMFGWTLLGLEEPEAVAYLTRALRTADRLNAQHDVELTLRLIAIAFAEAGSHRRLTSSTGMSKPTSAHFASIRPAWYGCRSNSTERGSLQQIPRRSR